MEIKEKYSLELLMDYVDGAVDQPTHDRLTRLVETDDEVATLVQGILGYYEVNENDREGLEEYLGKVPPMPFREKTPVRRISVWMPAAAAAAIIIAVAIWFSIGVSPDRLELAVEYSMEIYSPQSQVRGENDAALSSMETSYAKADYQAVIAELSTLPQRTMIQEFYLGLSLFNTGEFTECLSSLEIVADSDSRYAEHALWYLALAKIQTSDQDAEALLKRITEARSYNADKAQDLLSSEPSPR